jgi:hypothetical protein
MDAKKILIEDNSDINKNEYWDIFKTEDALLEALEKFTLEMLKDIEREENESR